MGILTITSVRINTVHIIYGLLHFTYNLFLCVQSYSVALDCGFHINNCIIAVIIKTIKGLYMQCYKAT